MNVFINQKPCELPVQATLADAVKLAGAKPPFATAVNTTFVPNAKYSQHTLNEGDRIEIISPVTGG